MEKVKVLIVDDSAFMRKLIGDFLSEHPSIQVVGKARNGLDALKKIPLLKPDVVTMDVEMPELNGLDAVKEIMETNPLPIVMLSSTTQEGAETTLLAIQYGAIDFVAKPSGGISLDLHKVKEELIAKVLSASKANLKPITKKQMTTKNTPIDTNYSKIDRENHVPIGQKLLNKKIVCIGTSTGGPRALQQVITRLPKDIKAPIFVVQHMPAGFTNSLANRLNSLSSVVVKEAEDGETARNGTVYIAPGGNHMLILEEGNQLKIKIDREIPPRNGHRPSVDVMFESISQVKNYEKIAVIMTGMGSDGSQGLIQMKKNGTVKAIAESMETSIVYGMPKAAVATNLVDEVQDVDKIAETIMKFL